MSERLEELVIEAQKATERAKWLTRQSTLIVHQVRFGRMLRKSREALERSRKKLE